MQPVQPADWNSSGSSPGQTPGQGTTPSVLVVASSAARRASLSRAMRQGELPCGCVDSLEKALVLMMNGPGATRSAYDAVLVDLPACSPAALKMIRRLGEQHVPAVIVCPEVSFDEAVAAMRAGAADIVPAQTKGRELGQRVRSAVLARRQAAEPGPAIPAKSSPTAARRAGALATPVREPADEVARRFARLIRSELDVESLLRQLLEFVLAHVGPTNAAVFLPGSGGDFALGAYVNCTCAKDSVEVMLDQLANIVAPRLERTDGLVHLVDAVDLSERLGEGADWLHDQHLLAFTCRDPEDAEGECLAVVTLFRPDRTPFAADAMPLLGELGPTFGAQLGRVVRIHHRHLPRDQWGALGDPIDGGDGLAS